MNSITLQTAHDKPIKLNKVLGRGGEATVYHVSQPPEMVAKLYHQPTAKREAKLAAMLANPPSQSQSHTAIAWPTDLLYQEGQFVGFLMPKVSQSWPIFQVYHPLARRTHFPHFTWKSAHRVAYNVAVMMTAIHAKGYVIGDINESNILVNEHGLATIVDTDSFQVVDKTGHVHRCNVGKPEYTPPELQGVHFSQIDQTVAHDLFGLGVLLFQLLMEGYHPFAGVLLSGQSVGRVDLYAMRAGLFPYGSNSQMTPPPAAPPFSMIHPSLQEAFGRCFGLGHQQPESRPTALQWANRLKEAETELTRCAVEEQHVYSRHQQRCPWCERQKISPQVVITEPESSPFPAVKPPKPKKQHALPSPPAQMTAKWEGQDLVITREWFEWSKFLLSMFLTLFWNGIMLSFLSSMFFVGEIPFFLVFHLGVGLWLIYQTAALWFNHTTVMVEDGQVVAYTKPISISGRTEIPLSKLHQLFCKQHVFRNKGSKTITYELHAMSHHGKTIKLAGSFNHYEEVLYIKQQIQRNYNIPNRSVLGEYLP